MTTRGSWGRLVLSIAFCISGGCSSGPEPKDSNFLKESIDFLNPEKMSNEDDGKLNENLFAIYKKELKDIEDLWRSKKKSKDLPSSQRNLAKNTLYKNMISQKNHLEFNFDNSSAPKETFENIEAIGASVLRETRQFQFIDKNRPKKFVQQKEIGFCFSRALMVHYQLAKRGIPKRNIRKVFAVGPLVSPPVVWKFHVATIITSHPNPIVVDPILKTVLPLKEWSEEILKLSGENPFPRLRFYITDARKFLPDSGAYNLEILNHPQIKENSERMSDFLAKKNHLN